MHGIVGMSDLFVGDLVKIESRPPMVDRLKDFLIAVYVGQNKNGSTHSVDGQRLHHFLLLRVGDEPHPDHDRIISFFDGRVQVTLLSSMQDAV